VPDGSVDIACHCATLFTADGELDELGFSAHIARMVECGHSLVVGSPGAGEGQSLTDSELGRIIELAVSGADGKVPVRAMAREAHDAEGTARSARVAANAGADTVLLFPLQGGHGMIPTVEERSSYYGHLFDEVDAPIGLMLYGGAGYLIPPGEVASMCQENASIVSLVFVQTPADYVTEVQESVGDDMHLAVSYGPQALHFLARGATTVISPDANIIPQTVRRFADAYAAADLEDVGTEIRRIDAFARAVRPWRAHSARWIKMCLRILALPGAESSVRPPMLMPADAAVAQLRDELDRLGVRDFESFG
jgi:4-hydroxy-tetrahydrodipicolinate synthase